MKIILHLDLDSYFVSAERTINPKLVGKPVVISSAEKRSIISAASYEAKKLGIFVPMPYYKALELAPNLISVNSNFALYTTLSTKLFELLANEITPKIEVGSIDECYIDATNIWKKFGSPAKLSKYIQELVFKKLKLPISIGIGNNKFIAKMSTQINKPLGITITKPGDFKKRFGSWPTSKIHGVGKPTEKILFDNGINTISDLINSDLKTIIDILGVRGEIIWNNVHEKGSDEIDSKMNDLKGIGNSITFMNEDKSNRSEILEVIKHLCNTISIRLNNRNMSGFVVSLLLKGTGGLNAKVVRRQVTLKRPISKKEDIFKVAIGILDDIWNEKPIKFTGVHITKLINIYENTFQQSIFEKIEPKSKIDDILAIINTKIGYKSITSLKETSENIKKKQKQSRYLETDRVVEKYKK